VGDAGYVRGLLRMRKRRVSPEKNLKREVKYIEKVGGIVVDSTHPENQKRLLGLREG